MSASESILYKLYFNISFFWKIIAVSLVYLLLATHLWSTVPLVYSSLATTVTLVYCMFGRPMVGDLMRVAKGG